MGCFLAHSVKYKIWILLRMSVIVFCIFVFVHLTLFNTYTANTVVILYEDILEKAEV